jgi:DNA-binding transcriptional MocR family regulator
MAEPIRSTLSGSRIGAHALADLLGHWSARRGPTGDGALYRLLALRIARLADTGELSAGLRLPPERDLASALSVSRNTVAAAYQLLRDEGMAESRQGAGTRIVPHRTTPAAVHRANGFFSGLLQASVVEADLSIAAVAGAPQVADALTHPADVVDARVLRETITSTGYFPHGLPWLREAIASHLTHRFGLPSTPDQVMITTGGQQALDLLVRGEVLPGQPVAVEDPTFPGVLDALHRSGASVIGVPADEGVDPDRLEHVLRTHRPALVYLIPTHHNPTGLVMSAAVRDRIARLAVAYPDTVFVDDMTLAELTLRDAPPPPPLAVAGAPNLVTVGSLSKIYWGGLRVGWIRGGIGLISRLAAAKATADLGSPAFQQAIVAALLDGQHDAIVKWRTGWLHERYDALATALTTCLPDWTWPRPEGGLTIWARLPQHDQAAQIRAGQIHAGQIHDSGAFAQAALRHGVAIVPGRLLSATGGRIRTGEYLRLAFTQPPAVLTSAVTALARLASPTD